MSFYPTPALPVLVPGVVRKHPRRIAQLSWCFVRRRYCYNEKQIAGAHLRKKTQVYLQMKADLAAVRAESVVLTRTEQVLKGRDEVRTNREQKYLALVALSIRDRRQHHRIYFKQDLEAKRRGSTTFSFCYLYSPPRCFREPQATTLTVNNSSFCILACVHLLGVSC